MENQSKSRLVIDYEGTTDIQQQQMRNIFVVYIALTRIGASMARRIIYNNYAAGANYIWWWETAVY